MKYDNWEMDCNDQKLILRLNGKIVDDIPFDTVSQVFLDARKKDYQLYEPKQKPQFKCWSCLKNYSKIIHENWAKWTCPLCGTVTSGTGNKRDGKTGAMLTLPPIPKE